MANEESAPMNKKDLEELAEKAKSAYNEFREALKSAPTDPGLNLSCRDCPDTPGGPICSSFVGDENDIICQRPFCGHTVFAHVG